MSLRLHASPVAAIVCALAASTVAGEHYCSHPTVAVLVVRIPPDAFVDLRGVPQHGNDTVRRIESPPLPAGCPYVYSLTATWDDGQGAITIQREVTVRAGQEVLVDLRPEALVASLQPRPESNRPPRQPAVRPNRPQAHVQRTPDARRPDRGFVSRTDGLTARERELLDLTNAERRQAGLPPLAPHAKLTRLARDHSAAMARQGQMDHTLNGTTFEDRVSASGYAHRLAAENIARGPTTPREAVDLWMRSPAHRANLLHPDHREIGVGLATGTDGESYYTQVFGTPAEY